METILQNINNVMPTQNRLEALKTLTKLLLYEVESLESNSSEQKQNEGVINLNNQVQQYEMKLICNALVSANGNQRKAAQMLQMKATTLHAKIKRYELDSFSFVAQFSIENSLENL